MALSQSIGIPPTLPSVPGVEFRHVPGFPGYAAGTDGSVWCNLTRTGYGEWSPTGEWRRKATTTSRKTGYSHVRLYLAGRYKHKLLQRLILETFVGPCPEGHEACHADGVRTNNSPDNLRWGTKQENAVDRDAHGSTARGEKNGEAKLTASDVLTIREMLVNGQLQKDIAPIFGVHKSTISLIATRKKWRHL